MWFLIAVFMVGIFHSLALENGVTPAVMPDAEYWFGSKIERARGHDRLLLEAIEKDHALTNANYQIGIESIINKGVSYWKEAAETKPEELAVQVNAALMLIFLDSPISSSRRDVALGLLSSAAEKGYWPAQLYVGLKEQGGRLSSNHLMTCLKIEYCQAFAKRGGLVKGLIEN